MNFKKTLAAAAAAAVAASSVAVSSSALFRAYENDGANGKMISKADSGMVLAIGYHDGERDADKDAVDYGIDWTKLDHIDYYLTIVGDQDFLENTIGGQLGISSNTTKENGPKNWVCSEFWGVNDPELGWEAAADKALVFDKVGDWTYKTTYAITDDNRPDEGSILVQIFAQQWSSIAEEAMDIVCYDASGNILAAFDQNGNFGTALPSDINFTITRDGDAAAPATGDVAAATDSSKGSPDTGIEDVAAVAGLALVAAGAIVVAKKRK